MSVEAKKELSEHILLLLKQRLEPKEAVEVLIAVLVVVHKLQAVDKSQNGLFTVLREAIPAAFVEEH